MADRPQFPSQQRGEKVIFKLRRHWFILLQWLVPPLVLLLVTVGVGFGIGLAISLAVPLWVALILLLSIGPLAITIWRILDWENDHYILTDRRILHIERVYFLFERWEEANLDKIQDVTVEMPSFMANMLYFGDVKIETAGTAGQIKFESVPKPRKVQRLIFQQAGLPEPGTEGPEEKRSFWLRLLRPAEAFVRMLYAVVPQGDDVVVWRKHWFVLLTKMFKPLLVAILVLSIWIIILLMDLPGTLPPIPALAIKVLPGIFFLIIIGWIAWIAIDWHNDLYVLTSSHVIDIEKRPFTLEFRREANLGMIQNVSYEQPSFISKLLGFGNTRLETAGTMGEFTFDNIPNPRQVQEVIMQHLTEFRKRAGRTKPKPAPKTEDELQKAIERILNERYGLTPKPQDQADATGRASGG